MAPRITLFLLLLLSLNSVSVAQDNVGEESTVKYPASYFGEWSPVTAQDMLDRIPGLSGGSSFGSSGGFSRGSRGGFSGGHSGGGGWSGGGGRGFGGGNRGSEVLINGKRTAGKNNSTGGQLSRITKEQVDYIEIIWGTSGELDVRGSGQDINVVLFDTLFLEIFHLTT